MFYVILVSHDNYPTLFGPYCSFKSALDIVQGPICNVPVGSIQEVDETYFIQGHDTQCSITICEADKIGCKPHGMGDTPDPRPKKKPRTYTDPRPARGEITNDFGDVVGHTDDQGAY